MFAALKVATIVWLAVGAILPSLAAPSGTLVNSNSNSDARALMAFLMRNYANKQVLSGQQDTEYVNWVQSNIGKTPAVIGLDFMDYSPSRVAYGSSSDNVEQAIAFAAKGGVVTFCWHWGSPSGTYNSASQPWWSNFYTEATGFDVAAAMNSPGSSNYNLIVRDIDAIATQLKRLQSAGVPVLWRPLHEAEGGWFWWGAKGAEPCKKLWALMYDRMTNHHGLNNLVWVWNSVDPSWYPGNAVVDVVSADTYPTAGNHDPQLSLYNRLKSLSGDSNPGSESDAVPGGQLGVVGDVERRLHYGRQPQLALVFAKHVRRQFGVDLG
jgi:mannan endo-1,4-beta-mannosidase